MDPLAFLLAHDATRTLIRGAEPSAKPQRPRRRRPVNRAGRVR